MRLLLDTHALLWWLSGDTSLPHSAKKLIGSRNSQVLVSAASAWEIATKVRLGRLDVPADLAKDFGGYMARERFESLSISTEHGIRAGSLPGAHKDPFDRMLVAQAQIEGLAIVSNDALLDGYGVVRVWF
ncbi:MAG TPA: type II toxin-antitoxin system VapC family toxin [Terriglobales bacterium]|jgi:PIN domain nuclease of toxin-antitoxin system|nr:type II toxin-antitoxin system VapC family toxin [Terriglobales bacterium]